MFASVISVPPSGNILAIYLLALFVGVLVYGCVQFFQHFTVSVKVSFPKEDDL